MKLKMKMKTTHTPERKRSESSVARNILYVEVLMESEKGRSMMILMTDESISIIHGIDD